MGGGGASVGKLIKGKGGDVSGNGQQQAPAPVVDGIASRQDVGANETAKHLSAFSDVAKEVDVWRKERRQAMLAAMDGPRHTRIAALVKEMTESARARLASEAEQKAKELRESLSRWTDAQQATRAEFDERVSLRDRRHHSADAQLTTLIAMFAEHMGNSTRELTALKEGLVRDLQAEIDTLRAQASEFTRANRLAVDALQRGSQESIALEESELAQAREAVKDQERLSALRVTLHAQIGQARDRRGAPSTLTWPVFAESCEQEYAAQHAEYVSTNGERTEEFVGMIERDRVVSQAIARNEALQARLTASCEDARRNLNAHRLQCANVNNGLSQANEKVTEGGRAPVGRC